MGVEWRGTHRIGILGRLEQARVRADGAPFPFQALLEDRLDIGIVRAVILSMGQVR